MFGVSFAGVFFVSGSTSEQITQASQMVLQFDSFLAGGWIVGFFFFWGNFGKDLRELRRLGYVTKAHSSKELAEYFKEESWEQNMRISTGVFAILALGIVNFVASGFCAVGAVLSTNGTLLVLALATSVAGTTIMLQTWYPIHDFTNMLTSILDKIVAYAQTHSDSP